jgi:hypothetical protein
VPAKTATEASGKFFEIVIVKHVLHTIVRYILLQQLFWQQVRRR